MKLQSTSNSTGRLPQSGTPEEIIAAARKHYPKTYHSTVKMTYRYGTQVEVRIIVDIHGQQLKRVACYSITE